MARLAKTRREKEVWEACDELWEDIRAEGLTIAALTGDKLKEKLVELGYKRGNQNQLYQYRNSWQEARGIEESEELAKEERVATLSERVQRAIANVHAEINGEAEERILAIRKDAEQKVRLAQDAKETMQKEFAAIKHKLEELEHENSNLRSIENRLNSEAITLSQKLELAQAERNNAEQGLEKAQDSFSVRLKELENHNKEAKEESARRISHLEELHAKENSNLIALHEKERHERIVEITNLREAVKKLEKENHKLTVVEQKTQEDLRELKRQIKVLQLEKAALSNELKTANSNLHEAVGTHQSLSGRFRELENKFDIKKQDYDKLQEELLKAREAKGALEGQLQELRRKQRR